MRKCKIQPAIPGSQGSQGFTLVEILITLVLSAGLMQAIASLSNSLGKAGQSIKQRGDMRDLTAQLHQFMSLAANCTANLQNPSRTFSQASPPIVLDKIYFLGAGGTLGTTAFLSSGQTYRPKGSVIINPTTDPSPGFQLVFKGTIGPVVTPSPVPFGFTPAPPPPPPQSMVMGEFQVHASRPATADGPAGALQLVDRFPLKIILDQTGHIVQCYGDPLTFSQNFLAEEICEISSGGANFFYAGACIPKCYPGTRYDATCPVATTRSSCTSYNAPNPPGFGPPRSYAFPPGFPVPGNVGPGGSLALEIPPVLTSPIGTDSCSCAWTAGAGPTAKCGVCCSDNTMISFGG